MLQYRMPWNLKNLCVSCGQQSKTEYDHPGLGNDFSYQSMHLETFILDVKSIEHKAKYRFDYMKPMKS